MRSTLSTALLAVIALLCLIPADANAFERRKNRENRENREEGDRNGGTLEGLLTTRSENFIEVRADGDDKPVKYTPLWKGDRTGGPDKAMLAKFTELKSNTRVRLRWSQDDHGRHVEEIQTIAKDEPRREGERRDGERRDGERRDGERRDGERMDGDRREGGGDRMGDRGDAERSRRWNKEQERNGGTAKGVITDKGESWIDVKGDNGNITRYTPRWLGDNGIDKDMVVALKQIHTGDKVELEYTQDDKPRVVTIEKVK